jgi:malonyl-CoA O-methyltransferase
VPALAVGIDLVPEMLLRARRAARTKRRLAAADVRALPCRAATFDVVWCRLVLGHVRSLAAAYGELARVARGGGHVIVTDFHAAAARAGHVRSFRDAAGELHVVEHHTHDAADHIDAARRAGLELAAVLEPAVGPSVRRFYAARARLDDYQSQRRLPLVLALSFTA